MINFSHIKLMPYIITIDNKEIRKVAVYNQNKIPTGKVIECIEQDVFNQFIFTMTEEHFKQLFLDGRDTAELLNFEVE